eukprot:7421096-Pyramimonas_sp.AAC.1
MAGGGGFMAGGGINWKIESTYAPKMMLTNSPKHYDQNRNKRVKRADRFAVQRAFKKTAKAP